MCPSPGKRLSVLGSTVLVAVGPEPFDRGLFSHGSPSTYPPDRSRAVFPSVINIEWSDASLDNMMADILRDGAKTIRGVALADGQDLLNGAVYVNYALFDTTKSRSRSIRKVSWTLRGGGGLNSRTVLCSCRDTYQADNLMIKASRDLIYVLPDSGQKSCLNRPRAYRTVFVHIRALTGCHASPGEGDLSSLAQTEIQG